MPSPTSCAVSGTIKDGSGAAIANVTVKAFCIRPFVHPTDGVLYANYEVNTTTDASGNWTLNLIETATPAVSITISFFYPSSSNAYQRKEYTVTVPNAATATFQSLIGSQI